MFKLAAVTAVAAAASMEEFQQTAELFTVTLKEEEVKPLKHKAMELKHESMKYEKMMEASAHPKKFQAEAHALAKSEEFQALVHFVQALKKKGPSDQIKMFHDKYLAQLHRVQKAHMVLQKYTHAKKYGSTPHHRL